MPVLKLAGFAMPVRVAVKHIQSDSSMRAILIFSPVRKSWEFIQDFQLNPCGGGWNSVRCEKGQKILTTNSGAGKMPAMSA